MATTDFVMPKLGLTMTEGTIARWDVAPGKSFARGDIILVVETDKIAYDVEAPAPGVLQAVLVAAGNAVPVGTPIGRWDVGDIKVSLDAPDVAAAAEPLAAARRLSLRLSRLQCRLHSRKRAPTAAGLWRRPMRAAWRVRPASICVVLMAAGREGGSRPPMSSAR